MRGFFLWFLELHLVIRWDGVVKSIQEGDRLERSWVLQRKALEAKRDELAGRLARVRERQAGLQ